MKLYYVNSGEKYCGHKHKTREAAERCNSGNGSRVLCFREPPPEGSQEQYDADAEGDQYDADDE